MNYLVLLYHKLEAHLSTARLGEDSSLSDRNTKQPGLRRNTE